MQHALLFEAQSIQGYLFDTGKLRDAVGASELVAALTGELLPTVLGELQSGRDEIEFSRKLGGAFYAFCERAEPLDELAALWSLALEHYAPGMRFAMGRGHGGDHLAAFDAARRALQGSLGCPRPNLPLAPPLAARAPRTGTGAVEREDGSDKDLVARATVRKRRAADAARADSVTRRFQPQGSELGWRNWPRNMEPGTEDAFPFQGEARGVAMVHVDGNGLGQLLMNMRAACQSQPQPYVELFRAFSEGIEQATETAAKQATAEVLLRERDGRKPDDPTRDMLAARPLVLGGDDVTLLVRADLAIPFVRAFTAAFQAASKDFLRDLGGRGVADLPACMTVGAGILYLHANQPFHMAAALAEDLCAAAKKAARLQTENSQSQPSTLAFVRTTGTLLDDLDETLACDHSLHFGGETWHDRLDAYAVQPNHELPALDDLLALQRLLAADDMARGPLRQLLGLLGEARDDARQRYRRWRELMQREHKPRLAAFDACLERLFISQDVERDPDNLPYVRAAGGGSWRSPLGDAIALNAVNNGLPEQQAEITEEAAA